MREPFVEISNPTPEELEETLHLAFGHLPSVERRLRLEEILERILLGTIPLEGIFQARSEGKRIGALFSQKRSDGSVSLWVPTMTENVSPRPFFESLERFCRRQRATVAIAFADLGQPTDAAALDEAGFEYLSDMLCLVLHLADAVPEEEPAGTLQFQPMNHPADFDRMVDTVRATYRGTRDFPRLLPLLAVPEVLNGYRDNAPFRPEFWFFVRKDGHDIGALLLSDQSDEQMELTYMGLIEEARGLGFGREIVRFAIRTARDRDYLVTSVDERNPAALRSYLSQGFRAWDRKNVYARFFT